MCKIIALIGAEKSENLLHKIAGQEQILSKIVQKDHLAIGLIATTTKTCNNLKLFQFNNLIGAFSGEIYNSSKLCADYKLSIANQPSTQIILPLFARIGADIIDHLDGFYAGFIYDKNSRQFFLLRDYIGKKTLFFGNSQWGSFITNQLKGIDTIENFQLVPKGFSQIKANKIELIAEHKKTFADKKLLRTSLIEVVKKLIPQNEKKFGVFLSGGLDSSIIAAIVAKNASNVIYYTLGNKEDSIYTNKVAKKLAIENKIKQVPLPKVEELPKLVERVVYHTESYNPSIISNGLATFLLAQQAREDCLNIVLTGEGADEFFCGYNLAGDEKKRFAKSKKLIENLHFTECRRLDMSAMAHSIEARCPFLDKQIYSIALSAEPDDLIKNNLGKHLLREAFRADLPDAVIARGKTSFDVGSGIRGLVVEFLAKDNNSERQSLKNIWRKYFTASLAENFYFHSYPLFDKYIATRGSMHKSKLIEKIEQLLWQEFAQVPFHNIFMLNNLEEPNKALGGTCSDKALHFQKILCENGIKAKLHSTFIKELECHYMLYVEIKGKKYFIDPGSGWLNPKVIPAFMPVEYSCLNIAYRTKLCSQDLLLFHKINNQDEDFKLMIRIPLKFKPQAQIVADIANRFSSEIDYPFKNSLRFTQLKGNSFYFLRGDLLRIYSENSVKESLLTKEQIRTLLENKFKFSLQNLTRFYTPTANIVAIISLENKNQSLERALKSLFNQSLIPSQILLIDGTNNFTWLDKKSTLANKYGAKWQDISIVYAQSGSNKNRAQRFNQGVDLLLTQRQNTKNTFVVFMSTDDEYSSNFFELSATSISKNQLDMVACTAYQFVGGQKEIIPAPERLSASDFLATDFFTQTKAFLIRLETFLEAGCFDENLTIGATKDLFIKIADLAKVKYQRLNEALINTFVHKNNLNGNEKDTRGLAITNFWLKYSKRMAEQEQSRFLASASATFNWKLSQSWHKKTTTKFSVSTSSETIELLVAIICSQHKVIAPLIDQLVELKKQKFIGKLKLCLLENNLSCTDKNHIIAQTGNIECHFISKNMQDAWIQKASYFKNFARAENKMFSIAQAKSLLQKYVGTIMQQNPNFIAWILDEDMQIIPETIEGLKALSKFKDAGIDVILGKFTHSSPNPPINGARSQLVDIWHNLKWLLGQDGHKTLVDISQENDFLIEKYPDYYYDLSRKHSAHLEQPFWIKPKFAQQKVVEAIDELCKSAIQIFAGTPVTRPLVARFSTSIEKSAYDSVNRGGNTIVFNAQALCATPNLNINIEGSDIRRSDMLWAIINKYYRQMQIKAADIFIWHSGKELKKTYKLEVNKVREEILGSCLYAALTDFLALNPDHRLDFNEAELKSLQKKFKFYIKQRLVLLQKSFYRARGIEKSLSNLKLHKTNKDLQKLTQAITETFNQKNFNWIEQQVSSFDFSVLSSHLKSMQKESDIYKETKI